MRFLSRWIPLKWKKLLAIVEYAQSWGHCCSVSRHQYHSCRCLWGEGRSSDPRHYSWTLQQTSREYLKLCTLPLSWLLWLVRSSSYKLLVHLPCLLEASYVRLDAHLNKKCLIGPFFATIPNSVVDITYLIDRILLRWYRGYAPIHQARTDSREKCRWTILHFSTGPACSTVQHQPVSDASTDSVYTTPTAKLLG